MQAHEAVATLRSQPSMHHYSANIAQGRKPSINRAMQAREAVATLRSQLSGEPAVITLDLEALRSTDLYAAAEAYEDLPVRLGNLALHFLQK